MTIITPTRFIPPAAVKVAHKHSDAVVYLYTAPNGRPAAIGYAGRAAKPAFWFRFADEDRRSRHVTAFFAGRAASLAAKAERQAAARRPHKLQLGHILVASWGYEQTNVDWFEVTKVVGPHMVEVRPIGGIIDATLRDQGRTLPAAGQFTGPASRHRVSHGDSVKINESVRARLWDGLPRHWTAYH